MVVVVAAGSVAVYIVSLVYEVRRRRRAEIHLARVERELETAMILAEAWRERYQNGDRGNGDAVDKRTA